MIPRIHLSILKTYLQQSLIFERSFTAMMNPSKYERQYFMPPETSLDWTKKEYITKIRRMSEPSIKLDDKKIDRIIHL